MEDGVAEPSPGRRIGAAAALLAASVLLSRVLGFAREMLLAHRVGASASTDAYYAAFQIPDLLNYLLAGGALSIAFVPLYARHLACGEEKEADEILATVLGTLGGIALAATLVLLWFAKPLVALQFPRFDPGTLDLTTRLTRIVLPAQLFFITGGIINAALLARNRFGASAAAPLLYNTGIIAGGLLLAPLCEDPVEGFSWGALAGAFLGPFCAPLLDSRNRVNIRLRFAPWDRRFLRYLWIAVPLLFGQTLLTVDEWYERWFGALISVSAVAHLAFARKLMLVPVALVGQTIAAAALPTLSRLYSEARTAELNRVVLRTLQTALALGIFIAALVSALAVPIVRLVYERGRFESSDTLIVASVLSILCIAVPAWITQQIVSRAFYARGDTWRPMLLGTAIALAVIPLYLRLGRHFAVDGLAVAGVIAMSINALATVLLARWLHGAPELTELARTLIRGTAVAGAGAVAAAITAQIIGGASLVHTLGALTCGGIAFLAVVVPGVYWFGDAAMRAAFDTIVRQLRVKTALRR